MAQNGPILTAPFAAAMMIPTLYPLWSPSVTTLSLTKRLREILCSGLTPGAAGAGTAGAGAAGAGAGAAGAGAGAAGAGAGAAEATPLVLTAGVGPPAGVLDVDLIGSKVITFENPFSAEGRASGRLTTLTL
jgi:hypothetical protein